MFKKSLYVLGITSALVLSACGKKAGPAAFNRASTIASITQTLGQLGEKQVVIINKAWGKELDVYTDSFYLRNTVVKPSGLLLDLSNPDSSMSQQVIDTLSDEALKALLVSVSTAANS